MVGLLFPFRNPLGALTIWNIFPTNSNFFSMKRHYPPPIVGSIKLKLCRHKRLYFWLFETNSSSSSPIPSIASVIWRVRSPLSTIGNCVSIGPYMSNKAHPQGATLVLTNSNNRWHIESAPTVPLIIPNLLSLANPICWNRGPKFPNSVRRIWKLRQ